MTASYDLKDLYSPPHSHPTLGHAGLPAMVFGWCGSLHWVRERGQKPWHRKDMSTHAATCGQRPYDALSISANMGALMPLHSVVMRIHEVQ